MRYSTLLHLPPLRFHCVGGWWNRTQDCCDFDIDSLMQHPPTQRNLRGGRRSSVEKSKYTKIQAKNYCARNMYSYLDYGIHLVAVALIYKIWQCSALPFCDCNTVSAVSGCCHGSDFHTVYCSVLLSPSLPPSPVLQVMGKISKWASLDPVRVRVKGEEKMPWVSLTHKLYNTYLHHLTEL